MTYRFADSVLLIFCKAPVAGQVKTRLQPALSAEQAVAAHIALTRFTLERAFRLPLCEVWLYCAPDTRHDFFMQVAERYPVHLRRQTGAGLGERMQAAFAEALSRYRHAILIGCDCPSLTPDDLQEALQALADGIDLVTAPAEDGGYVLVGMNKSHPGLFSAMPWGSNEVMTETRRRADIAGLNAYELAVQWDVDTIADWQRFLVLSQPAF